MYNLTNITLSEFSPHSPHTSGTVFNISLLGQQPFPSTDVILRFDTQISILQEWFVLNSDDSFTTNIPSSGIPLRECAAIKIADVYIPRITEKMQDSGSFCGIYRDAVLSELKTVDILTQLPLDQRVRLNSFDVNNACAQIVYQMLQIGRKNELSSGTPLPFKLHDLIQFSMNIRGSHDITPISVLILLHCIR